MIEKIKIAFENLKALFLTNKRLGLAIVLLLILLVIILNIISQFQNQNKSTTPQLVQETNTEQDYSGSLTFLALSGNSASLNSSINLQIKANSDNQDVAAGNYLISFNPELVAFENQKNLLESFDYIRRVKNNLIFISTVKKLDFEDKAVFKDQAVLELQFKTLKEEGVANFELIFTPEVTAESALWNAKSQNLVSFVSPTLSINIK